MDGWAKEMLSAHAVNQEGHLISRLATLMGRGCSVENMAERLRIPRLEAMERAAVLFSFMHREYAWTVPDLEVPSSETRDGLTGLKTQDPAVREIRRMIRQVQGTLEESFCVAFLNI